MHTVRSEKVAKMGVGSKKFYISEMSRQKGWTESTYYRWDGKREFRQEKQFGNWHVVFDKGASYGIGDEDKYNALGSPMDKFNHLSLFVSEQLGTSENVGRAAVAAGGLLLLKWLLK
jgi:hypothetical protein